jgi:hypothetical protein
LQVIAESVLPMVIMGERLADVANTVVAGETKIDQHRGYSEGSELPGERQPVRQLVVPFSTDGYPRELSRKPRRELPDGLANSAVVLLAIRGGIATSAGS